jgi:predicted 3-demethylubiquinone-9 3-methyltransferase (glyoxalase superfamily)
MNKVTPFLWFDTQAHEAAKFYVSVFKRGSKNAATITSVSRYTETGPGPAGSIMTVGFTLGGQAFTALNAGPHFRFSPAISFVVHCDDQKEVDYYWAKLIAGGGAPGQCGWLTDRFGLSWQIVPKALVKLVLQKDTAKATRAMASMMKMQKLDIRTLEDAAAARDRRARGARPGVGHQLDELPRIPKLHRAPVKGARQSA